MQNNIFDTLVCLSLECYCRASIFPNPLNCVNCTRKRYNINVGLSDLIDDDCLLAIWDHIVLLASKHYEADFIVASAGFDAGDSSFFFTPYSRFCIE